MRRDDRILIGIGPATAQALLGGLVFGFAFAGCSSSEKSPPPPSAFLGGVEPPPDFDPYLTAEQRMAAAARRGQQVSSPLQAALAEAAEDSPTQPPFAGAESEAPNLAAIARAEASTKWSIVIATFRGPMAEAAGLQALEKTRNAGVEGAYLERRGESIALAFGRYESPDDPLAQEALASLQALEIDGGRPFAQAMLAPPSPDLLKGSVPEYNLRTVKQRYGDDALYTLQIGVYGRAERGAPDAAELAEYRQLAERAVYQLRREGEEAFYYHAPTRSMVTVGVFGPDDHDPQSPGLESPRLEAARALHPHNLLNGQGIRQKIPGRADDDPNAWKLQPSSLVGVPRS